MKAPVAHSRHRRTSKALITVVVLLALCVVIFWASVTSRFNWRRQPLSRTDRELDSDGADLGESVRDLKKKMNALRQPVEALLERLSPLATKPAKIVPPNYRLRFHKAAARRSLRTIFVAVAVPQEDNDVCRRMISDIFLKAKSPERVYVGLAVEDASGTTSCLDPSYALCNQSEFCATDQIRFRVIAPIAERSGAFSNTLFVAKSLYHHETYFAVVTANAMFAADWDELSISQYEAATKMLLAVMPTPAQSSEEVEERALPQVALSQMPLTPDAKLTHICLAEFRKGDEVPSFVSVIADGTAGNSPRVQPFMTLDFFFTVGDLMADAPSDAEFRFASFHSLSFLTAARMYTKGFGFYSPSLPLVHRQDVSKLNRTRTATSPRTLEADTKLLSVVNAALAKGAVEGFGTARAACGNSFSLVVST